MAMTEIGIAGLVMAVALLLSGMPIGISFLSAGFVGMVLIRGMEPALTMLGQVPLTATASYVLTAIPLYIVMGQLAFYSGISNDLFTAAYKWIGRLPGGLALATNLACTGFAACSGTSVAGAATMGHIAYPEMERFKYSRTLSTGVIAAGGTLGILIPPSVLFVIYGLVTETSIGALLIAGILPGIMLSGLFCLTILIWCRINPNLAPPSTEVITWRERVISIKGVWGMTVLFGIVIGGLYVGVFSPSEAGAVGSFGAFLLLIIRSRSMGEVKKKTLGALRDTAKTTAFFMLVVIGVTFFNTFVTLSGLAQLVVTSLTSLPFPPSGIMIAILAFYIPLGMVMDGVPMVLLTMPFVFPVVRHLGFDPVWFGVLICILAELSLVTPPVGMNLYVLQGVTKVPLEDIVKGIIPFAVVLLIGVALIFVFPQIALFLPNSMAMK